MSYSTGYTGKRKRLLAVSQVSRLLKVKGEAEGPPSKDFQPLLANKLLVQRDQIERYKERLKKQKKSIPKQAASSKKSLPSLEEQYDALTEKLKASRFLWELRRARKEARQQLKKWKRLQDELDQLIRQRKMAELELAKWSKIHNEVSRFIERTTDVNARRN